MKNIKYISTIIAFLLIAKINIAQSWQWARQNGSSAFDSGVSICVDSNGNSYFGGTFSGGGQCFFTNDTSYFCQGYNDFYLIKYDANGNEQWWRQFGSNNSSSCHEGVAGMTSDANNNIYITGAFCGVVTFGSTTLTGFNSEIFIAKYDVNGNCVWAKKAGGFFEDIATGIAVDGSGYIYVCGTNNLDSATFDNIKIPRGGFIAKYDANGNCLWAKNKFRYFSQSSVGSEVCYSDIKISGNNILLFANVINDTIVVDTITVITPANYLSNGLFSFDLNGNIQWIRLAGGPNPGDISYDFTIDNTGNSYITGTFTADGIFGNDTLHNGTQTDAYLAKYDINGNFQWVQQLKATGGAYGHNVSSTGDGNVYVTGNFLGSALFDTYNLTASNANGDMFVARYNNNGTCLGVRNFGEASSNGVTQDANGNPYVCGTFKNSVSIGGNSFSSHGMEDVFIAKLDVFTGVEEGEGRTANNQLIIYANPTTGKSNITVPDDFVNEKNLTLSIYDNIGKLIQQKTLEMNDGKIELNLESEAKGIYNVTLSNKKKSYNGKIIFE